MARHEQPIESKRAILIPAFRPDGTVMDLSDPRPEDIDFAAMANGLSKLARFNGIYRETAYSVAQHSVMGSDALYHESGDAGLAGYFVLHDGHEYLTGDITRPAVAMIGHYHLVLQRKRSPRARSHITLVDEAVKAAKRAIDKVVWQAAGMADLDLMPVYKRQVHDMDDRMLRAEGIALFGPRAAAHLPAADRPAPKLTGAIRSWGAMKAEEAFLDRLEKYLGIVARTGR